MKVTVSPDQARKARDEGSVLVVEGTGPRGQKVTFAGDHRPMAEFLFAVIGGGEPLAADVETWQVI